MAHPYEWYKEQSTDNLILLKEDSSQQLFKLQDKPAPRKVKYWTTVFATIKAVLKERSDA